MAISKEILYYGKKEPLPEQISLRAGPLKLVYENGDIRYVRLGEHEILRRVYVAIRDHNWGTVLPKLSNIEMDIGDDAFHITYDVENKQGEIDFWWKGAIEGKADGTIIISMDGVARASFRRNRIGFCVLHPMELAGAPCHVEHVDGSSDDVQFPIAIAPQLVIDGEVKPVIPFNEMRAMTYPVTADIQAEIRFEGDIFEMEDQRNWTDASYKTYCTPLRLPFPVEVPAGTRIAQKITLRLKGKMPQTVGQVKEEGITLVVGAQSRPLPDIGLGCASHGQPLSEREIERLQALNLSHLRVGLRLSQPGWEAKLRRVSAEARAIGAGLEVALFLSRQAEAELAKLVEALPEIDPPLKSWLVFHEEEKTTSAPWIRLARQHLSAYDPGIPLGSGTNVFFTELNRERPPLAELDLVCYSLNPQVHAFDNLSLVETLAAQAATVESARRIVGEKLLAVTPVTLKMRFNPNATGPEPDPPPDELPPQVDERQMSLFGAGWTLGSLKYLAGSGVHSLTYYETSGWRGVMETEAGSPLPAKFPSLPASVFPMYHVFADVGEFAGGETVATQTSNRLLVEGLTLRKPGRLRMLAANLSNEPQQVSLQGLPQQVYVRVLDENHAVEAMTAPEDFRARPGERMKTSAGELSLYLLPYAIARIDTATK